MPKRSKRNQFKFNTQYAKQIENVLYNICTSEYTEVEHVIQQRSDDLAVCLLCLQTFKFPIKSSDLEQHFQSDQHVNAHKECEFELYHKLFMDFKEHEQYKQIHFLPCDCEHIQCTLCDLKIGFDSFASHCNSEQHVNNLASCETSFIKNFEDDCNFEIISNDSVLKPINYAELSLDSLQLQFQEIIDSKAISPLVVAKFNRFNMCLFCSGRIKDKSLFEHLQTRGHKKNAQINYENMLAFHQFWLQSDPQMQPFARQFRSRCKGKTQCICILCSAKLKFASIEDHIDSPCVIYNRNHEFFGNFDGSVVDLTNSFDFPLNYCNEVLTMLYPLEIMQEVRSIDLVPIFTIQRQLDSVYCLICYKELKDCVTLASILKHVKNRKHLNKTGILDKWRSLAAYHRFWLAQEPHVQLKQYKFRPHKRETMKCNACKQRVTPTNCLMHIKNGCNSIIEEDDDECSSYEHVSHEDAQDEIEESVDWRKPHKIGDLKPILDDQLELPIIIKKPTFTFNFDEVASTSHQASAATTQKPFVNYEQKYCEQVKNALYPLRIRRISNMFGMNADYYYLQKMSRETINCLACDTLILGYLEQHLNGRKHIRCMESDTFLESVTAFHSFWLEQPDEAQQNQICFSPFSNNALKCKSPKCNKIVPFEEVPNHNCPPIMVGVEVIECKDQLKHGSYSQKVETTLYPRAISELMSKFIDIPVAQCRIGRIVCLFCNHSMLRSHELLQRHLEEPKHVEDMAHTPERIKLLVDFHNFWMSQPSERQIYQMHYSLHSSKALLCTVCKQAVNYENCVSHTEKCCLKFNDKRSADINKLVRKLAQITPKIADSINNQISIGVDEVRSQSFTPTKEPKLPKKPKKERLFRNRDNKNGVATQNGFENVKMQTNNKGVASTSRAIVTNRKNIPNTQNKMMQEATVHDVIPSVAEPQNADTLKRIPHRYTLHLKYLTRVEDTILCSCCGDVLSNELESVFRHIFGPTHTKNAQIVLPKYNYYCEICGKHFRTEDKWLAHLYDQNDSGHLIRVNSLGEQRRQKVQEYECISCKLIIFGDPLSIIRHKQTFPYKTERNRNRAGAVALSDGVKRLLQSRETIEKRAAEFDKEAEDVLTHDEQAIEKCLRALEKAVAPLYPNSKAYAFGSRVAGAGNKTSDLDIFMDVGEMYLGLKLQESLEQQGILNRVKKIIITNPKTFMHVSAISGARTPILQFVHCDTNLDCDLSFRHGLSVENTKYIKLCNEIQPIFRSALVFLKKWASMVNLKEEINSYAFCLMFFFQLQLDNYLLPVHELRAITNQNAPIIDGWDTIIYNLSMDQLKQHITIYEGTVFDLVMNFFKFYQSFNFETQVVCPLLGKTVPKKLFTATGSGLPRAMGAYCRKLLVDSDSLFRSEASMCVQDPFDLSHNLTKAVPKHFTNKFQRLCELTHNYMKH